MDVWEQLVMMHLTAKQGLFVRPQYDMPWHNETKSGGSCPDFVGIHPGEPNVVYVIEVSTAWNLKGLSEKFQNREKGWYEPLRKALSVWGHRGPFKFKAVAYVRKDAKYFTYTAEDKDVEKRCLEDIAFIWRSDTSSSTV